jgi:thiamine biosynthesis lipoprotein
VELWKIGKESFTRPADTDIRQALGLVNYRDLVLDPINHTAGIRTVGQSMDLGAIGKGLAGDRVLEVYRTFGVDSAYSNLGGNVVTLGSKPDGSPWHVGIQHPRREDQLLGSVSVFGKCVVTSGDYQRFASDQGGKKYHHILSPVTGYPTESELISVTIVSASSTTADALSTALFVTGIEKGLELLKSFPETEAILMDAE